VAPRAVRYAADGWGVGELWLEAGRPVWHELPRPSAAEPSADEAVAAPLVRYFAGERVALDEISLAVEWPTAFAERVAEALRGVPWGEVVTYGELAALAGHPGAQRAVGTFCARNPLPLFVPCHRVVAASGVGPYGSLGSDYKRRLLALEGHALG
jgi:methylated-DNA-[protein]-cysteine S-methyltransferase